MAYIITTKKLMAITAAPGCDDYITQSSRAVTTLDEARDYAHLLLPQEDRPTEWDRQAVYLPANGGTIGPLPNGTVIEVEHWGATRAVNWMVEHGHDPAVEFFIDAYNKPR